MLKPSPRNFATSVGQSQRSIGIRAMVYLEQLKCVKWCERKYGRNSSEEEISGEDIVLSGEVHLR